MRTVVALGLAVAIALAGCGAESEQADSAVVDTNVSAAEQPDSARTFKDALALSSAAAAVLGPCESAANEVDVTGANYKDCELASTPGVSVRFSVFPSMNQAVQGASYYSGQGPVHQEGKWAVSTNGDQQHLDEVVAALAK